MKRRQPQTDPRLDVLDLTEHERAVLGCYATVIEQPAGTHLCRQGQTRSQMLWLLEGRASVARGGELVAELVAGDIAGEASFLADKPFHGADVTATEPSVVATVTLSDWSQIVAQAPTLSEKVRQIALSRLAVQS